MSTEHSTNATPADNPEKPSKPAKPAKPYPEFPLTPHPAGYWCKRIRGKLHYFGKLDDPDAALQKYLREKDALHAGRTPRPDPEALTVKDLVNAFLNHKLALVESGELSKIAFSDYNKATDELIAGFGKARLVADLAPDDFERLRKTMAAKWGAQSLAKTIQSVRSVFKYAFDADLMDRPMRFGPGFKRPSKKVMRLEKARKGVKLFTAEEIQRILTAAGTHLKAMILLGINCGYGNADCGTLPIAVVDLEKGMIDFPRPKTGIPRRCALWPETIQAIRDSLSHRPKPKKSEHDGLVFLTRLGDSWHTGTYDGPLSREFGKLLKKLGINGRQGLGFYTLRHTFRTIADEAHDQPAADYIMGHEVAHMSSVYRERISDERLKAVSDHVRSWVFSLQDQTKDQEVGTS